MTENNITVQVEVRRPIEKVWELWNGAEHISGWAFASDDWQATAAVNDVRVGGKFKIVMSAKDGSESFDFAGTYTKVEEHSLIEYDMDDGRHVRVQFRESPVGVEVVETFEAEKENPGDMQRAGWQAILDNFKKYAESKAG